MPFRSRLMVGLEGNESDLHLLRYASMVVRLGGALRYPPRGAANGSPAPDAVPRSLPVPAGDDPEIRFVYLVSRRSQPSAPEARNRAALRAQVEAYFTRPPEPVVVGCDLLRGRAISRLPDFAADFETDLLMLGHDVRCSRMVLRAPCSVWLVPLGWAPVLRRVLVPIDFSERSAACLRAAIDLIRYSPRAKCLALHVYQDDSRFSDESRRRELQHALDRRFDQFLGAIDLHGVAVEPIFEESPYIERAIDRAAHHHAVDLIVMASRKRSRGAAILLPSVTERAIRQCRTSILLLKPTGSVVSLWQALRMRLSGPDPLHFS